MSPHDVLSYAALWWLPRLADHMWQSSLLALLLFAAASLQRSSPAGTRHLLWVVALVKFLIPVIVVSSILRTAEVASYILLNLTDAGPGTQQTSALIAQFTSPADAFTALHLDAAPLATQHSEFYCAALVTWVIGVLVLAGFHLRRRRAFYRLLRAARDVDRERERRLLDRARTMIGVTREIRLVESDLQAEPAVWGTLRPVILVPAGVGEHLDDDEFEAVLLHELAHVKRWDNFVINTHLLLLTIFWFNPLVWLIGNGLLAEREQACDEEVLKAGVAAGSYVSGLLKVVKACGGWRVAGVASIGSSNLKRRVENIMTENRPRTLSPVHKLVLFASLLVVAAGTLLPNFSAVAAAVSSDVQQNQARLDQESEAVLQEIELLTDQPIAAENPPAWPVQITRATFKFAPRQLLERLEGVKLMDQSDTHAVESFVEIVNNSGKKITRMVISFCRGGKVVHERHFMANIEPGQTYSYRDEVRDQLPTIRALVKPLMTVPGGIEGLTVKVRGGNFEDESSWGEPTPKMKVNSKMAAKMTVEAGLLDSRAAEKPVPVYPVEAKSLGIAGVVVVAVTVDVEGKVTSAEAMSGPESLRKPAVEAAYRARFSPTTASGVPVIVKGVLTYNFVKQ